ncbi:MAG: hypothetical protein RID91_14425 [Azospirillaceae bacterium]
MSLWQGIGLFLAAYILLLARSAWRQGEARQFVISIAVVGGLIVALIGLVMVWSRLSG